MKQQQLELFTFLAEIRRDARLFKALRAFWHDHGGPDGFTNGYEMAALVDFVGDLMGDATTEPNETKDT